jgi:hypothetical protein
LRTAPRARLHLFNQLQNEIKTIEQTFDARSRLLRNGITVRLAHGSRRSREDRASEASRRREARRCAQSAPLTPARGNRCRGTLPVSARR